MPAIAAVAILGSILRRSSMITKPVPHADNHVALVHNESQGSTRDVITAITHGHGSFLQLEVIRRISNYLLAGLETRRIDQ